MTTAENRPRRRLFDIEPLNGNAPWVPPRIPKDRPQQERLRVIREILDRNVGILRSRFEFTDGLYPRTTGTQSTGFLINEGEEYYAVTAQHCLNPNFVEPSSRARSFTTVERKLLIPNQGTVMEVQGAAIYFTSQDDRQIEDVGIMQIETPPVATMSGRGLELMTPEEFRGTSDDGTIYYAGYPGIHGDVLQIRFFSEQGYRATEDMHGCSGGPVFGVMDGKIKVFSLVTKGRDEYSPGSQVRTRFANEPHDYFLNAVRALTAYAKGN